MVIYTVKDIAAGMMEKGESRAQWGNCIGYILLPFPIVLRDDPLDYVRTAKSIADRKKLSYEAFFTFSSASLLFKAFGLKVFIFIALYNYCCNKMSSHFYAGS